jgi:CheY-like chemotaxis protein
VARKKKILVVDDDKETVSLIRSILTHDKKYEVCTAGTAEEALQLLESESVDLVLSDLSMPGMSGAEFLSELRNWDGALPVIFVSGHGKDKDWSAAVQGEASAMIAKPFRKETLLKAVQKVFNDQEIVA